MFDIDAAFKPTTVLKTVTLVLEMVVHESGPGSGPDELVSSVGPCVCGVKVL